MKSFHWFIYILVTVWLTCCTQQAAISTSYTGPADTLYIVKLSEQEPFGRQMESLTSLDREQLDYGGWSEEDLKSLANNMPYEDYLSQLNDMKQYLEKIGYKSRIISVGTAASGLNILTVYHSEISSGSLIHLRKFDLYENDRALLSGVYYDEIYKGLKKAKKPAEQVVR